MTEIYDRRQLSSHYDFKVVQICSFFKLQIQAQCGWILCSGVRWYESFRVSEFYLKLAPIRGGQGETEEADNSTWVSGRFVKQGNLHTRLVSGSQKTSTCRALALPARILIVYMETFTEFSHIFSPGGLSNTWFLQGCILENCAHYGNYGQNLYSKNQDRKWGVQD